MEQRIKSGIPPKWENVNLKNDLIKEVQ